jgi:putative DNA methylase
MSGAPIASDYIRAEGKAGRIGARLMALVAEGDRARVYLTPTQEHEASAWDVKPAWKPDVEFFQQALGFRIGNYGMSRWSDLFTGRQLTVLTAMSDLVEEAHDSVRRDALVGGVADDPTPLRDGGTGATAYADAVGLYLGFAVSKAVDRNTSLCVWEQQMDRLRGTFGRQALPMVWDYVETNPFAGAGGDVYGTAHSVSEVLDKLTSGVSGRAEQRDAQTQSISEDKIVSTDPPYYDNIGYADLWDFFYVWLRRSLRHLFPDLFTTLAVPKAEELVATPARHGGTDQAERFFLDGMKRAMRQAATHADPDFPVTIYYAFKQAESDAATGTASTGWETFLDAVISAGFAISGTWPIRTELLKRMRGMASNALASSIVLACRARPADLPTATRREFVAALRAALPDALAHLQRGNIAPVDLAQAAIGPGMAVFTRYSKVLDAEGNPLSVRQALALRVCQEITV